MTILQAETLVESTRVLSGNVRGVHHSLPKGTLGIVEEIINGEDSNRVVALFECGDSSLLRKEVALGTVRPFLEGTAHG